MTKQLRERLEKEYSWARIACFFGGMVAGAGSIIRIFTDGPIISAMIIGGGSIALFGLVYVGNLYKDADREKERPLSS